jgi:hypothetical protein
MTEQSPDAFVLEHYRQLIGRSHLAEAGICPFSQDMTVKLAALEIG